ncbi:tRNA (adenosine(37)-N6)-threonylcarbamoyltransferase complex ATPase subunit type 1 TsaE [Pseudogemmobacter sonorensis]|uniref:tRNA (adenosine(37)-N6)-threonylcarbamoyltransferase complex ATPase subunit type 1 TsaE n=1 Tax=Pseudogemmobacter sonorensis TaxID=2989681 RepID=UPI0036CC29F0
MSADPAPQFVLQTEKEARRFGARLGALLRPGRTVLLEGPVGAGKSHIARAAIRALAGEATEVPSPSFTLVQTYDTPGGEIWHADLYRLTHPAEAEELGLLDAMETAIVLVEWPDRLGADRPGSAITLTLSHRDEGRGLTISGADSATLRALAEGLST